MLPRQSLTGSASGGGGAPQVPEPDWIPAARWIPAVTDGPLAQFIGAGDVTHLKFAWGAPIVTVSASGGNTPVPTWDFAESRPQASITPGLLYRIGPL